MCEPRRVDWRRIAQSQHGVISRSQFIDAGVGPNAVTRMAAGGELDRAASGVYLVGNAP